MPPRKPAEPRAPIDRIGATVLGELVQSIVSGEISPDEILPSESELSTQFGVSRTVIRESMKRLQEKGLVTVAQGRGTHVNPTTSWNVLDPLVLSTMIGNDGTLGVLDDLTIARAALEAAMASTVAEAVDNEDRSALTLSLAAMAERIDDTAAFHEADVQFHLTVMERSGNRLAENIGRALYVHATRSDRFVGITREHAFEMTMDEHTRIVEAISSGDPEAARVAMSAHILDSWARRRLPSPRLNRH